MNGDFVEVSAPSAPTPGSATVEQALHGPLVPPHQRILLYGPDEWEAFAHEWAHFCLKPRYLQVQRFSGAGDKGIDIAGFTDNDNLLGAWDNYQCKRFLKHAIYPTEAWPEIGKILWHSYNGEYCAPRRYYFVSPKGVGTTLANYLTNTSKLKDALIENWNQYVRNAVTSTAEIVLEGDFLDFVQRFDFHFWFKNRFTTDRRPSFLSVSRSAFWWGPSDSTCSGTTALNCSCRRESVR